MQKMRKHQLNHKINDADNDYGKIYRGVFLTNLNRNFFILKNFHTNEISLNS